MGAFAAEPGGLDLLTIQKILGHTSLNTTAIYTHVRRDHLQAVAQVLDLRPGSAFRGAQHL
jgi:site-specific recombinase XerD